VVILTWWPSSLCRRHNQFCLLADSSTDWTYRTLNCILRSTCYIFFFHIKVKIKFTECKLQPLWHLWKNTVFLSNDLRFAALNDETTVDDELQRARRERSWHIMKYYFVVCLEGLRKITRNTVMIAENPGRGLEQNLQNIWRRSSKNSSSTFDGKRK
jgi:hypothetical protein